MELELYSQLVSFLDTLVLPRSYPKQNSSVCDAKVLLILYVMGSCSAKTRPILIDPFVL